jgi:hypothetical protein
MMGTIMTLRNCNCAVAGDTVFEEKAKDTEYSELEGTILSWSSVQSTVLRPNLVYIN